MSLPSNIIPAIHNFSIPIGDKKELHYTFPYTITGLTFDIDVQLKKDRTVSVPTSHAIEGTTQLYVVIDATETGDGTYIYGVRHTGDGLPVTCIKGEIAIKDGANG